MKGQLPPCSKEAVKPELPHPSVITACVTPPADYKDWIPDIYPRAYRVPLTLDASCIFPSISSGPCTFRSIGTRSCDIFRATYTARRVLKRSVGFRENSMYALLEKKSITF